MTRIYLTILLATALLACAKKPMPEAVPPCCVAEETAPLPIFTAQVYFDFNSDALDGTSEYAVQSAATFLTANPAYALYVDGYADTTGRSTYNDSLSQRRADRVWSAITSIKQPRMGLSIGHGEGEERTVVIRVVP